MPDVNMPVSPSHRPSTSRFGTVDKENVESFIKEKENENKKRKALGNMRLFTYYVQNEARKDLQKH